MSSAAKSTSLKLTREVNYIRVFEFPNLGRYNVDTRQRLAKEIEKAELIANNFFVKAPIKRVISKTITCVIKRKILLFHFRSTFQKYIHVSKNP